MNEDRLDRIEVLLEDILEELKFLGQKLAVSEQRPLPSWSRCPEGELQYFTPRKGHNVTSVMLDSFDSSIGDW